MNNLMNVKDNAVKKLNNKKGFTMVEIIVVLVILGILIAVALPSMVGFVDEARGKALAADARVGLVAAQAVVTEQAAGGKVFTASNYDDIIKSQSFINMTKEVTEGSTKYFEITKIENNQVTGLIYTADKYTITIADGTTTIKKD